jgi:hypothetical protein
VRQVGYLPELYEDALSEKYKTVEILLLRLRIFDDFLTKLFL